MKRIVPFVLLCAACLLVPPTPAAGQATPASPRAAVPARAPQMVMVAVVRVRPDKVAEYVAFQKSDVMPMLKKAGVPWRDMWRTATFGNTYEFTAVTPIDSMAQFDAPDMVARALGEDGARAYYARVSSMIADRHVYALRVRPDLGYNPQPGATPKVAVVVHAVVAPGRQAEFEGVVRNEMRPALERAVAAKTGATGWLVGEVGFGGKMGEYIMLSLEDNFASIAKGPPTSRVLGAEAGGRLAARMAAPLTSMELSVARYQPELSYSPTRSASQ